MRYWKFAAESVVEIPAAFVAQVPGGAVVGDFGAVLTADNELLFDLSPYSGISSPEQHPIFRRLRLPPAEVVDGTVAVLSKRGGDNYYHFMVDTLPRIGLLEDSGLSARIDRFVVNRSLPFQRQLLQKMGLPDDRIIESSRHPHVRAKLLVAPSLPAWHNDTPKWVCEFLRARLRDHLPHGTRQHPRRFFVSRGSKARTRRLVNEDGIQHLLLRYDVTPVRLEEISIDEQIRLFRSAELIVAPHGAGLANLVFCSPGAAVIEVFHPSFVNLCFWKLASQVHDLRYFYLFGEGRLRPPGKDLRAVAADIRVDIDKLERVLQMASA